MTTPVPTTPAETFWETDFTEVSPLDDWTEEWNGANFSLSIVDAINDARVGNKDLLFNTTAASRQLATYDPPGSGLTDCEVLCLVNMPDVVSDTNEPIIVLRASGGAGNENGYYVDFVGASWDIFRIQKIVAGSITNLTGNQTIELSSGLKPQWIRFRVSGQNLYLKVWNYSSFEPHDWTLTTSDSSLSSGKVGIGSFQDTPFDTMYFAVSSDLSSPIPVPELTYGTFLNRFTIIEQFSPSIFTNVAINYARLFGFEITEAVDGKNLTKIAWATSSTYASNVRTAVYIGSDPTDPRDAVLIEDFGASVPSGANAYQIFTLSSPYPVEEGDCIYIAVKGNDSGSSQRYMTDKGNAQGTVFNNSGRWDISAGESKDETVAWSANLAGDTISQSTAIYVTYAEFGDPPTTAPPTTLPSTTLAPTTLAPTTLAPTTLAPTTSAPTTLAPTTIASTTEAPTTVLPTTVAPSTVTPTTLAPSTLAPTTLAPSTEAPTTLAPTTEAPTTVPATTVAPTTLAPTTLEPTTPAPTTPTPTTLAATTEAPTTVAPTTIAPTTPSPTTVGATTLAPTTVATSTSPPTTVAPSTVGPTTLAPTTPIPSTAEPTTLAPTTEAPTTLAPTTLPPTTLAPTTLAPTTVAPTTIAPTTVAPTTSAPTTVGPTTLPGSTLPPTTLVPTTPAPYVCIHTEFSTIVDELNLYSIIVDEDTVLSEITDEGTLYSIIC